MKYDNCMAVLFRKDTVRRTAWTDLLKRETKEVGFGPVPECQAAQVTCQAAWSHILPLLVHSSQDKGKDQQGGYEFLSEMMKSTSMNKQWEEDGRVKYRLEK